MTSPPATAAAPSSAVNMESAGNVATADTELARSWADHVVDLDKDAEGMKPKIRVRGNSSNTTIKAVPRQLTCFVGRLAPDVIEELTQFLTCRGIVDVRCKKITARNRRTFNTSAVRVSCSAVSKSLFYDEGSWSEGAELRDWIFYNNNGRNCFVQFAWAEQWS